MFFRQSEPVIPSDYQGLLTSEIPTYGDRGDEGGSGDGSDRGGEGDRQVSPHSVLINHQRYCSQLVNVPEGMGESLEIYHHPNYFFCQVFWKRETGFLSSLLQKNVKYNNDPVYIFIDYPVKILTICRDEKELEMVILRQRIKNPVYSEYYDKNTKCGIVSSLDKTFWGSQLINKNGKGVGTIYSYSQTKIHVVKKTIEDLTRLI